MSKINSRKKTVRQCVCCGFNASTGTLLAPDKFMCRACEQEAYQDSSDRYEDESWAEVCRVEAWLGRMETY